MRKMSVLILLASSLLFADTVTLKGDRQVSGVVESGNTQELHVKVGNQSQTIDIHDVQAIQLSASPPPSSAPKTANLAAAEAAPNILILNDGTHVAGTWWSLDDTDLHFLVNGQLQHYPRHDVAGVTFGNATLPAAPAPSTPSPAKPAQPPSNAAPPAQPPTLARSSPAPPRQPPTLKRPSDNPSASATPRGVSQPEEVGRVYFWNGKVLIPLELSHAVERNSRSNQYWEMPSPKSPVRVAENSHLVFILRLPQGVDPASYILFQLETVNGSRRTHTQPGRRGTLATWPVDIEKNDVSGLITYNLTVRDLPTGEYSFSPSSSNDAYCFGIDPDQ
jgi:hypothetical protein